MKVQELRQLLSTMDRAVLEKAFAECYKQLPKHKKEEMDQIIEDILTGKDSKKAKATVPADFESLKQEIGIFIQNAYAQNYFVPNRVIPKNQRSKWRFCVKNYIKELQKISQEDEHYGESVKLLEELYELICQACNYYLFSTEDPFRSIGWQQPDFFLVLVNKVFGTGYTRENISKLLLYAATGGLSREALHIQQEMVLLSELKTSDVKYMAVEEAKKLIDERINKLSRLKQYDSKRYDLKEAINNLCNIVLMVQASLVELEAGIQYYFKTCIENDKEIVLYRALDIMDWIGENGQWLYVYEYGNKLKIKPREFLVSEYNQRKELLEDKRG